MVSFILSQQDSLIAELERVGIRHGDTAEIDLTVGVIDHPQGKVMAFCSSVARLGQITQKGWRFQRRKPMSKDVVVHQLDELRHLTTAQGILCGRAQVTSNGHTTIRYHLDTVRMMDVAPEDLCLVEFSDGRVLSEQALEQLVSA